MITAEPTSSGPRSTVIPSQPGAWKSLVWQAADWFADTNRVIGWSTGSLAITGTGLRSLGAENDWQTQPVAGVIGGAVANDRPVILTLVLSSGYVTDCPCGWDWNPIRESLWRPPLIAWWLTAGPDRAWQQSTLSLRTVRSSTRLPLLAGNDTVAVAIMDDDDIVKVARSNDGIKWSLVSNGVLPPALDQWSLATIDGAFLLLGQQRFGDSGRVIAYRSTDGTEWQQVDVFGEKARHIFAARVVAVGRDGALIQATTDITPGPTWWFQSSDGVSWRFVDGLFPLGTLQGDRPGAGRLPDGQVVGNGDRIVAYDTVQGTAAWTSFDGSTWTPLAIGGTEPTWIHLPNNGLMMLPDGLIWRDGLGHAWQAAAGD